MSHPTAAARLLLRAFPALLLLLALATGATAGELRGRVQWIYDGDTIEVAGAGKVRLLGIDTPEKESAERDRTFRRLGANVKALRQTAREAMRFNIAVAKGQTVRLTFDRELHDRYGRTLAYVTLPDGRMLNRLLLEQGDAVVYRRFDFARKEEFLAAEAEAKRRGVGMWGR
jgi:micrococcal nuclease